MAFNALPRALRWIARLFHQAILIGCMVLARLLVHGRPHFVLVQSPPALPLLLVLRSIRLLMRIKIILDVHNLAFTLMRPTTAYLAGDRAAVHAHDTLAVRYRRDRLDHSRAYSSMPNSRAASSNRVSGSEPAK